VLLRGSSAGHCSCGMVRLLCRVCAGSQLRQVCMSESSIFTCQGLFDVSVLAKASVVTEWAAVSSSKADRTAAVPPP
jgi:hypothetical protein